MSEVKRYDLCGYGDGLVESADGAWYHMDDYDALRAENERLRDTPQHARDSAELRRLCAERDTLKAELAALKAQPSGVVPACPFCGKSGEHDHSYPHPPKSHARLNSSPVGAGLAASECACGDQYPANSYGAGFMAANNGVCENCDAANSVSAGVVDELLDWFEELLCGYDWLGTGSNQAAADADQDEAWDKWAELRAALTASAPNHSEQVRGMVGGWIKCSERMPEKEVHVIALFPNSSAKQRIGFYAPAKSIDTERRGYDGDADYCERDDCSYWPEGWYFWEDGMEMFMCSTSNPVAWMPAPKELVE